MLLLLLDLLLLCTAVVYPDLWLWTGALLLLGLLRLCIANLWLWTGALLLLLLLQLLLGLLRLSIADI